MALSSDKKHWMYKINGIVYVFLKNLIRQKYSTGYIQVGA